MASKLLVSWGVGLLLAATTWGCSSGSTSGNQCAGTPNGMACMIDGSVQCTNTHLDSKNCGQCGVVCSGNTPECKEGVCSSGNSNVGGSSNASSNKGGSSNSSSNTTSASQGGNSNSSSASQGGNTSQSAGGTSSSSSNGSAKGGSGQGGTSSSSSTGTAKGGTSSTGAGGTSSTSNTSKGGTSSSVGGTSASNVGGTSAANVGGTSATSSSTGSGNEPGGWWKAWKDEGWHGCAWTAIGADSTTGTKIDPEDFKSKAAADPYTVWGNVAKHPDYKSVALLGFNLNQDTAGADCGRIAQAKEGPPGIAFASGKKGIAVNVAKGGSHVAGTTFTLRVQIQTPKGNLPGVDGDNDRWCQTITVAAGKAFMPFEEFTTKCWNKGGTDPVGDKYANQAISAIVFTVPGGKDADLPFEFTINGFALGNAAEDAPDGSATTTFQGTIGGPGGKDKDYERTKVVVGGEEYIIQNNNWGKWDGTDQTLSFKNNSFKITLPTGAGPGGGVPASFPSIYIGHNGSTLNGMHTSATDNLPMQVSAIKSVKTTYKWTGTCGNGFNASYDVWFSASKPTAEYTDAISGFVMVWLCDPGDAQPIGSKQRTASIAGNSWDVWVGPRGGSGTNSNAPVVSYTKASGSLNSLSFDLLEFIKDASTNGIQGSWYLTDVFGGFEIWNGGSTNGLSLDEFTCVVE
ncbi:MAG TPA: hypothetical protein VIV60_28755 [Polyangiaceae bacterium]